MKPVTRLISLRLGTPKLDDSVDFYARSFGLSALAVEPDRAVLAGADGREVLVLARSGAPELQGITFAMASTADLDVSRAALADKGFATEPADGSPSAFSVRDPDGHTIAFVAEPAHAPPQTTEDGRPLFVSHVVLNSGQADAMVRFFVDDLGFTVADRYENNLLTFLRCAQPQHHCIGVAPGERAGLNHFSVDCGSVDGLMKGFGRMRKAGHDPVWGPGRHGPGGNVFCYYEDPSGFVPEFTCDVLQIEDDAAWVAREWPRVPEVANVWGTGGPSPRAVALMSGKH